VNICTQAHLFNWDTLNYDYYILKTQELIDLPIRKIGDL